MNQNNDIIKNKMKNEGLSNIVIDNFLFYYNQYIRNQASKIYGETIKAPKNITKFDELGTTYRKLGKDGLKKTVMIKLNGGLGTSMGLKKAKSLIKVKKDNSFLDIIAKQAEHQKIPLILMNSFNTQKESLTTLQKYDFLNRQPLPLDFIQNKVPKIAVTTKKPVNYSDNKKLEWCPPGHGDIYSSLLESGILDKLVNNGYEYAFISNADNLGATLNIDILGYLSQHKIPFLMEVANRTESDKKGGHLAFNSAGNLILREIAQCPEREKDDFQNYKKYKYFNTNNIWVNLKSLKKKLQETENNLKLPMIVNEKPVNPREKSSEKVVQLETAMGAAIEVFQGARALCVPRTRFVPVKTTNDLLKIRSDLYRLDNQYNLKAENPGKVNKITIDLDPAHYGKIDAFNKNFSNSEISLKKCDSLSIKGDIMFKGKIVFEGDTVIEG